MVNIHLIDNPEKKRFEADLGGSLAYIEYRYHDGDIILIHTYVPDTHRGQGIAGQMIRQVLDYIREQKIPLKVYCPVINTYLDAHPEYMPLLDEENP
jgi:uncharacterized protein